MLNRERLKLIVTLWIVALIVVSLQPWRPMENSESPSIIHRAGHMAAFGAAALMLFALRRTWAATLGIFCLAVAIEISQHLLYKNGFEWWDVRDDTIGLALAAILIRWTRIRSLLLKTGD